MSPEFVGIALSVIIAKKRGDCCALYYFNASIPKIILSLLDIRPRGVSGLRLCLSPEFGVQRYRLLSEKRGDCCDVYYFKALIPEMILSLLDTHPNFMAKFFSVAA